jgi:hypothetical protein
MPWRGDHLQEMALQGAGRRPVPVCRNGPGAARCDSRSQRFCWIRELRGHQDVSTTMIYTHVLNRGGLGCRAGSMGCASGGAQGAGVRRLGAMFSLTSRRKRGNSAREMLG